MAIWEYVLKVLQFMDSYYITDILCVQRIHNQQISNSLWQLSFLICFHSFSHRKFEPPHDKTNKMACAPNEDVDQPGHPASLIRVFAIRRKKSWVLSYPLNAQRRLWSDWAVAQADRSLRWAYIPLCWFCREAAHLWERYREWQPS